MEDPRGTAFEIAVFHSFTRKGEMQDLVVLRFAPCEEDGGWSQFLYSFAHAQKGW